VVPASWHDQGLPVVRALLAAGGDVTGTAYGLMGHVVHLRLETGSALLARGIALEIVDLLYRWVPELDASSTTVSHEELQNHRDFVLCGRWAGDGRSLGAAGHLGEHTPQWLCG
jgi:hypothetical protein